MRGCRKRTGPRESSLIAIAIITMSGASASRRRPAPTQSNERLTALEERLRPNRRIPSKVIPSTSSSSTDEPTTSGSRGSTLTLTPIDFRLRVVFRRSLEIAPPGATIARSICSVVSKCSRLPPLRPAWPFVLGSLPPLRPAWPFLAGSGSSGARPTTRAFRPGASLNRRVIQSAVSASPSTRHRSSPDKCPGQVPGEGANGDRAREQQHPNPNRLVAAEVAIDDQLPTEPDQERVERRNPEQGGDLVERRLSDQVLVAVVQSRHLSDHEHQRERQQGSGVESIRSQKRHADQDRDPRRSHVREREGAAVDRIPTVGRWRATGPRGSPPVPPGRAYAARGANLRVAEARKRSRRIAQLCRSAFIRLFDAGVELCLLFGHRRPLGQTAVVRAAGRA